ncbi:MAG: heavy-metal-associated domain-containing protein [Candidatus Thiothrix singaporensis]|uniref:Heavy-metal-associated domain-containing protein n=1 Tax=Candidatus Thiothrix singaporensis TaxID=2799669 RepID=A0A7L6AU09_9GAMM|nr:MAG: heavy-metal-associated domain-containing protein [Candidatus Thiothrix singaporensis]
MTSAIDYMHHTPGRLRLKGRHFNCHGAVARRAVIALEATPGVEQVRYNKHAGSLTVHYDPQRLGQDDLINTLEIAGCIRHPANIRTHRQPAADPAEKVTGLFGKALVGALAQRTASHLIGKLL